MGVDIRRTQCLTHITSLRYELILRIIVSKILNWFVFCRKK